MNAEVRWITCPNCQGQKMVGQYVNMMTIWSTCPICQGVGQVEVVRDGFGTVALARCEKCGGRRVVVRIGVIRCENCEN